MLSIQRLLTLNTEMMGKQTSYSKISSELSGLHFKTLHIDLPFTGIYYAYLNKFISQYRFKCTSIRDDDIKISILGQIFFY